MAKRIREHQGRKYGVKLWMPSDGLLQVASNRVDGMTSYFIHNCAHSPESGFLGLRNLARAAYMQGINDAIEVQMRLEWSKREAN